MAKLLFKLNGVPEDEADDVRQLLDEKGFEVYETKAGFFGLGVAAIWMRDKMHFEAAKQEIDNYQVERAKVMRERYEQRVAAGEEPTLWDNLIASPIRAIGLLILICFVLAIMLLPFWIF